MRHLSSQLRKSSSMSVTPVPVLWNSSFHLFPSAMDFDRCLGSRDWWFLQPEDIESSLLFVLQYQNSNLFLRPFILIDSFSVEVSWAPWSRVLLLTPSRTCLDAAASLSPPLRLLLLRLCLLLCERLHISSSASLYWL